MPFPTIVNAICNICTLKGVWTALNQIVGCIAVVYRTRMLATPVIFYYLDFCFSDFYLVSSFRVNLGLD